MNKILQGKSQDKIDYFTEPVSTFSATSHLHNIHVPELTLKSTSSMKKYLEQQIGTKLIGKHLPYNDQSIFVAKEV